MTFFRVFKHLLPRGKAWRVTIEKTLRRFFEGLTPPADAVKTFIDQVWKDVFPQTTRELTAWEKQWGLLDTGLTPQERRDRLDAAWKALGGQSPKYIQDALRAHGFDVYVHEWWTPGTEPAIGSHSCAVPRSPIVYLRREFTKVTSGVECGEALAACGEAFAEAGNGIEPKGYPLVNRILRTAPDVFVLSGEGIMDAGEALALCGNYDEFRTEQQNYIVPSDITKWSYFLYIGAQDITDVAQIDLNRKDEFEALCLKICPAHLWLGILVEYT